MKMSEETLEGAGGIKSFFRSRPPDGKARGVAVIAPDLHVAAFKGLDHVGRKPDVLHLKKTCFHRDPNNVRAMNDDPLIAGETQPTHTLAEMVRADERLRKEFHLINLPLLILHGTG